MKDKQSQRFFDAGNFTDGTRRLVRERVAEVMDAAIEAFCQRHPEIERNPELYGRMLAAELSREGKNLATVTLSDLELAWEALNTDHTPVPPTPAPSAEPKPEPVPAPMPPVDDGQSRLDNAARALIEIRNFTRASIEAMSSEEFALESQRNGQVFSHVVELLIPRNERRQPTLGELQQLDADRALEHERQKQETFREQCAEQSRNAAQRNSAYGLAVAGEQKRHLSPWVAGQIPRPEDSDRIARERAKQRDKDRKVLTEAQNEAIEKYVHANSKHALLRGAL